MKRLTIALAFASAAAVASTPAAAQRFGTTVIAPVDRVFVPVGFDDNDEIEVVLEGSLPDTCHRLTAAQVDYSDAAKRFTVTQLARRYQHACLPVTVPFTTTVRLGRAPMGSFTVLATGSEAVPLDVKEASSAGPDDHVYAPVDSVLIDRIEETGRYVATIEGRFTSTCMRIEEVKVINSGATVEALPILREVDASTCAAREMPFSWRFDLPEGMQPGRHLLHVRSLNGQAVNKVFAVH